MVDTVKQVREDPEPENEFAGLLLDDRFLLRKEIGQGGYSTVYCAEDRQQKRTVAVKVLRSSFSAEKSKTEKEKNIARFEREAKLAAEIADQSDYFPRIYATGCSEGLHYYAMELLKGCSLRHALTDESLTDPLPCPLPWHSALSVAYQICRALVAVHRKGIVHRDIKPENLFVEHVGDDMRLRVLDLGVAKIIDEQERLLATFLTGTESRMFGTLCYTAPEVLYNDPVTYSADLYAVGLVLYEMLTGVLPFDPKSPAAVFVGHCRDLAPAVSKRRRVPPGVDELVAKALEKRPDDRYPDAEAMAAAIANILTNPDNGESSTAWDSPEAASSEERANKELPRGLLPTDEGLLASCELLPRKDEHPRAAPKSGQQPQLSRRSSALGRNLKGSLVAFSSLGMILTSPLDPTPTPTPGQLMTAASSDSEMPDPLTIIIPPAPPILIALPDEGIGPEIAPPGRKKPQPTPQPQPQPQPQPSETITHDNIKDLILALGPRFTKCRNDNNDAAINLKIDLKTTFEPDEQRFRLAAISGSDEHILRCIRTTLMDVFVRKDPGEEISMRIADNCLGKNNCEWFLSSHDHPTW